MATDHRGLCENLDHTSGYAGHEVSNSRTDCADLRGGISCFSGIRPGPEIPWDLPNASVNDHRVKVRGKSCLPLFECPPETPCVSWG